MKSTLILILGCCCKMWVFGQVNTGRISGTVHDNSQKAIEAATIRLLQANDQKWIKSAVSDQQGRFELAGIAVGKYIVSVTAVGFADKKSETFEITAQDSVKQLSGVLLEKTGKLLQEVTVTGKKPMVENQIDKTVVNVDAFITTAGGTAMEVLEKSPGISVDRDGNISLKGKQGVIILVDGKQTFLG
jgi:iron complex outermembrane receptor protein